MTKLLNSLKFLALLLVQVLPVVIIVYFALKFRQPTENGGWIVEAETGCKCWTNRNFENRSFTWTGECSNGYANGAGVLQLIQHGYEYTFFEGTLFNGKAEGQGKLVWLDGDRFEGEFRGGIPHGFGRFFNDDGDYYEGNYETGARSGKGTYWYPPESRLLKYEGSWQDGLKNGPGTLFFRDGTRINGTFINGVLSPDGE